MQSNNQITVTILNGFDGGLIIYENVDGDNRLVFGGNLSEASDYLTKRMEGLCKVQEKGPPLVGDPTYGDYRTTVQGRPLPLPLRDIAENLNAVDVTVAG